MMKGRGGCGLIIRDRGSPDERVGKPSAQNWTKHRGDHNAKAENGESLAMLLTGEGIEQNSLTQGDEWCTA